MYDSRTETLKHINQVREYLEVCQDILKEKGMNHDLSKLSPSEKDYFDKYTPKLRDMDYSGDPNSEYQKCLESIKPALEHHYANNSHHPEHYKNGIYDMDLFEILEMLVDWKAASLRHETGDIRKSLEINKERFGYDDKLYNIFLKTIERLEERL